MTPRGITSATVTFDLVLRGGTVVDGTGAAECSADVAITAGRIVEVGNVSGNGDREALHVAGARS